MLATNQDAPAWSRIARALRQAEPPKHKCDVPIDTERLVWDQEYRDEVRILLKTDGGKT